MQRFTLTVMTLIISIILSLGCMVAFDSLFYWQNNPEHKLKMKKSEMSVGEVVFYFMCY